MADRDTYQFHDELRQLGASCTDAGTTVCISACSAIRSPDYETVRHEEMRATPERIRLWYVP